VELTTVGIDVGSSTSHITMSHLHLQRLSDAMSSRFVTVERTVLFQSAIILTPYSPDDSINADALERFVRDTYASAGIAADSVDTGAVILTGEAVKRRNARAINARLAALAGSFVSTTAGPRLEAIIAAHGSGGVAVSKSHPEASVLNVDIGGGTTKFALIRDGRIVETAAVSIGGRLIATELADGGPVSRLETAGEWFARRCGIQAIIGKPIENADLATIGSAMAEMLLDVLADGGKEAATTPLWVTPPLRLDHPPDQVVLSGGVAEYVLGRESARYGDLGLWLGSSFRSGLEKCGFMSRIAPPTETIRATALGASQYTVQASGNTVMLTDADVVPVRNLRVVSPEIDLPRGEHEIPRVASAIARQVTLHELDRGQPFALAFRWRGAPFHGSLLSLARSVASAVRRIRGPLTPLVLLFDGDVARSIGEVLREEVGWPGPIVCLDGLRVDDFDVVDIGARIDPAGTYPVVVKSLVYPSPADVSD
jgi:ethanolamine utilization protein EutA